MVGAGAAGLLAALAARGALDRTGERRPAAPGAPGVLILDGSPRVGLKILISGGGRCNVTNERVTEADFETDLPHVVRGLLKAFPPESIRTFFEARGCPLQAEALGKLFPVTNRAMDVLDVLLRAVEEAGARLQSGAEVVDLGPASGEGLWRVELSSGHTVLARRVIIATGGKSLPRTGSRGFGYEVALRMGHRLEEPLPALTPLFLEEGGPLSGLAGVTLPAILSLVPRGTPPEQVSGARFLPLARAAASLLVTHRGVSGPAALDVSGACDKALRDGARVTLQGDFWTLTREDSPYAPYLKLAKAPGASLPPGLAPRPVTFEEFHQEIRSALGESRRSLASFLGARVPRAVLESLLRSMEVDPAQPAQRAGLPDWKRVHLALTRADLRLSGADGYLKAEVTRGGVPLSELNRATLESKLRPSLFFCGEVLHATGRLGGFNFQWAWSSGFAAGRGAARQPP